jgi:ribosomal protein L30/L7E
MSSFEQECWATICLNSEEIFKGDAILMDKLNQYVGTCSKGRYILGILSIVKKSDIHIINDNPKIAGMIDVVYIARTLNIIPGHMLLVSISISNDVITLGTVDGMITVSFINKDNDLKVGNYVLAKVVEVEYPEYSKIVNAKCEMYKENKITYIPFGEVSPNTLEIVKSRLVDTEVSEWKVSKQKKEFNLLSFVDGIKFDGKVGYKYSFGNVSMTNNKDKFIMINIDEMILELTNYYIQEYMVNKQIISKGVSIKNIQ